MQLDDLAAREHQEAAPDPGAADAERLAERRLRQLRPRRQALLDHRVMDAANDLVLGRPSLPLRAIGRVVRRHIRATAPIRAAFYGQMLTCRQPDAADRTSDRKRIVDNLRLHASPCAIASNDIDQGRGSDAATPPSEIHHLRHRGRRRHRHRRRGAGRERRQAQDRLRRRHQRPGGRLGHLERALDGDPRRLAERDRRGQDRRQDLRHRDRHLRRPEGPQARHRRHGEDGAGGHPLRGRPQRRRRRRRRAPGGRAERDHLLPLRLPEGALHRAGLERRARHGRELPVRSRRSTST